MFFEKYCLYLWVYDILFMYCVLCVYKAGPAYLSMQRARITDNDYNNKYVLF